MKKLLIIAIALIFATVAMAADNPTDKGSIVLQGNASFSSLSGDIVGGDSAESITTINIVPSVGFFISPNLFVGADIEYIKLSQGDQSGSSFGIGPTVGYYFNMDDTRIDAKGAIYPYIKGFFIWTTSKLDIDTTDMSETLDSLDINLGETPKVKTTTFGGQAGLVFMLSNSVGANFSVRYSFDKYKPEYAGKEAESVDGNTLNIGVGITAFIY